MDKQAWGSQLKELRSIIRGDWAAKTNAPVRHTENSLDKEEIARFSELINIGELQAYRMAVARNSENIIRNLKPEEMKRGVYQANLQRILDEHAIDDGPSANKLFPHRKPQYPYHM